MKHGDDGGEYERMMRDSVRLPARPTRPRQTRQDRLGATNAILGYVEDGSEAVRPACAKPEALDDERKGPVRCLTAVGDDGHPCEGDALT